MFQRKSGLKIYIGNGTRKRIGVEGIYHSAVSLLTCEEDLQGLMLVNLTKLTGRLDSQKGKDLAYLEYVSTAPWNRIDLTDKPIFRGVGLIMVRTAVELSHAEGFRRRIGLHSLPQAAHFYRTVCGMADLGLDTAYHNLRYFEMTEAQAAKFCS